MRLSKALVLLVALLFSFSVIQAQHGFNVTEPVVAEAQAWELVISHDDGTHTKIGLSTQPHVSIAANSITITSSVASMKWKAKEVVCLSYQEIETGVHSPKAGSDMFLSAGKLVFPNVSGGDGIAIYSVNGMAVPAIVVPEGCGVALQLSSLPSGIYLISVQGKTFKFIKP